MHLISLAEDFRTKRGGAHAMGLDALLYVGRWQVCSFSLCNTFKRPASDSVKFDENERQRIGPESTGAPNFRVNAP